MDYIDIRNDVTPDPQRIKFADDTDSSHASFLCKPTYCGGSMELTDGSCGENRVRAEDVSNLILALTKAQELGWGR